MTEELEQLLKNLKLRRILEIYDEQLRAADKGDISYSEFLTRLVRAQWQAKQEGALEWRIRRANLPERWTLETFPWVGCGNGKNGSTPPLVPAEFTPGAGGGRKPAG
jgi:DNA replication protein DnaC